MKNSGIEWIGEIPDDWEVVYLSSIFDEHKRKNKGMISNNLLSLSYGKIKRKDINTTDGLLPESFEGYNVINEGDIVLRLTDLQNDQRSLRTGIARETGIVTSAYVTIRCLKNLAYPDYMHYYLNSFDTSKGFYGMGDGVRQGLSYDGIKKIEMLLPELSVQQKIAEFLDKKCAAVDKLIANQQGQIEKLKEYKQATITQAVTKGLNPSAPMKDSGVEWIGNIPQNWQTIKLKYCTYIRARLGWKGLKADEYVEEGYPLLSAFNIINDKLNVNEVNYINQFRYDESPEIKLSVYDIILVKDGAGIGKCAIIEELKTPSTTNGSLAVITTQNGLLAKYLYYYFVSIIFQKYIDQLKAGMGVPHLFQADLKEIQIPFASWIEQQQIADYLDKKCSEIDKLISIKQAKIEKLNEYKKSLIYEYVTGKKEVV